MFTVRDSGSDAASAGDIHVFDNALGYVLNQGGTVHFSPDDPKAYDFSLDFAVVTFADGLEGLEKDYEIEAVSSPSGVTHVTFARASV